MVLLIRKGEMDQHSIEKELVNLDELLRNVESPDQFCLTHELVDRNRITNNKKKIIKYFNEQELKPFSYFIGKN